MGTRKSEIPPPEIPETTPPATIQVITADARHAIQENAVQTIMPDLGEKLGPLFRYRAEERLDRAVTEVHSIVQPVADQLSERLAEVDLHLRSNARNTTLSHEELKQTRIDLTSEVASMRTSLDAHLNALRSEVMEILKGIPRGEALKLERITFWQILGAVAVGGLGVTVGFLSANSRHDRVVRDALLDASW
jgi:hypothetical protein